LFDVPANGVHSNSLGEELHDQYHTKPTKIKTACNWYQHTSIAHEPQHNKITTQLGEREKESAPELEKSD
jgi:hypothetical protein